MRKLTILGLLLLTAGTGQAFAEGEGPSDRETTVLAAPSFVQVSESKSAVPTVQHVAATYGSDDAHGGQNN